jgi:hypothetical protein
MDRYAPFQRKGVWSQQHLSSAQAGIRGLHTAQNEKGLAQSLGYANPQRAETAKPRARIHVS